MQTSSSEPSRLVSAPISPLGAPFLDLAAAAAWYEAWLWDAALPHWAIRGVDPANGAFEEALDHSGRPQPGPRRARVQARQVFVFATAARLRGEAGWARIAQDGFAAFSKDYRRPDGTFATLLGANGQMLDDRAATYDQAFALLALSSLAQLAPSPGGREAEALQLLKALEARRRPEGGFAEVGSAPFQANANMHLLEAALAWERAGHSPAWAAEADGIANLALNHFIDPQTGALEEFFDAGWRPLRGAAGLREPGHHFEWASLLKVWSDRRRHKGILPTVRRLFDCGRRGVDAHRGVAVGALWEDFTVRDNSARLWPQTEYLRSALALGENGDALAAANTLAEYLAAPILGMWRDRMTSVGDFVPEAAPASSLYHMVVAVLELLERSRPG